MFRGDAAQTCDHGCIGEAGSHKVLARHLLHDAAAPRHDAVALLVTAVHQNGGLGLFEQAQVHEAVWRLRHLRVDVLVSESVDHVQVSVELEEQPARFLIVGVDHRHAHTDADVVKARLYSVTGDQKLLVRVRVRVRVRMRMRVRVRVRGRVKVRSG